MSGSDPSPSSTTSEPAEDFELRFRQQGQLVIDGFKSLMSKHGNDSVGPDQACIFQEVTPALSTEKDIRRDPGSKLSRLLELQLAIDNSMTRSKSIEHMQFQVAVALNAACEHIEALNLCIVHESMEDTASDFTDSLAPSFYEDLIHKALIVINSTIKLRSESELIFASRSWEQGVHGMTQKLREAIGSLGGSLDHLKIQILHSSTRVVREPVIRLTELLIPIIKLSRLFFNKLSGSGVHKKQLPAHTEMNSKQMKCLYGSAQDVARDVSKLLNLLYAAEVTRWNTLDTRMFSGAAGTLASRFEAPKLLFLVHVIPLIQEIDLDYYENWFATWNTQFGLAINNFQYYARSFDHIPG
ncbi:hypothetical protein KEM48_008951 [Puccinia striiformis f. sp. tritici PST-130]|nr:hypothetical protein KEM48_008951 [Puccinia striiformis f. sp. tritici PST-130]